MGDNSNEVGNELKKQREVDDMPRKKKRVSADYPNGISLAVGRILLPLSCEVSATKTLADLPYEIKDEIFFRLAVRTLWQIRCVIRDYSRFHNPNFMNMHFQRQMEIDNASTFVVTTHTLMYKINIQDRIPVQLKFPYDARSNSFYSNGTRLILAGSCNGLLCLTRLTNYGSVVFLWNPITGNLKQLPKSLNGGRILALGLGYDYGSGKFKVVAISKVRKGRYPRFEAFVYTVGTSSWRSIGQVQKFFREPKPHSSRPKVFKGSPHWAVPSSKSLISFSVGKEEFNEIPMPFLDDGEAQMVDFALGYRLSVFSYVVKWKRYDLWVRLENTWTKQMSFNELDMTGFMDGYRHSGYYGYKDTKLYGGPALLDAVIKIIKSKCPHCKLSEPFFVFPFVETIATAKEDEEEEEKQ